MKVEEIILENFGPFVGRQILNLRTSETQPLVAVSAANGRGKTFLYRAIRWTLYGRVFKGKAKVLIPEGQLVNFEAIKGEAEQMSVTLKCVSEGEVLEIIRIISIDPKTRVPSTSRMKIIKDGQTLSQSSSEHLIRVRLDESISRFFFFDGETLEEYENLLDNDSGDVQIVRTSVEAILGAPALSRLTKALGAVERSTMSQIKLFSKADAALQELASAQSDAEEKMRGIEEDLSELKKHASEFQNSIRGVEAELSNFEYARDILGKISAKEEEKDRHLDTADRSKEEVRISLQVWQIALTGIAEKSLEVIEPIRESAYATAESRTKLNIRLEAISASTKSGTCSVCNQSVSSHAAEGLKVEVESITARLRALPDHEPTYLTQLSKVVGLAKRTSRVREKATLKEKGRNLEQALQAIATLDGEIDRLQDMVSNVDQPRIMKIEKNRIDFRHQLSVTQTLIQEKNRKLDAARAELEKCKRNLAEAHRKNGKKGIATAGSMQKPIRVNALASNLCQVFGESYDDFVGKMRESVSESANRIFRLLISDEGYKGLLINKNFGLSLLNEDDRIVDLRSSGQSQVVAVSLILALHECAVRSGTLLMDTPFGRLDKIHRLKLMNYFARELTQVILFVQSGELDEVELSDWADFTSRSYRLERGSATSETFIMEI